MNLYPVVLDFRPDYLRARSLSVLQLPVGSGSVLDHLRAGLSRVTSSRPLIVAPFEIDDAYRRALAALGVSADEVLPGAQFSSRLRGLEPSDWLLVRDSRFVSSNHLAAEALVAGLENAPSEVRHLVAPIRPPGGMHESLLLDAEGQVSRIQRYYEGITWCFGSGVALSVLPGSCLLALGEIHSLAALRNHLAVAGLPTRDTAAEGRIFDLGQERGLLLLAEELLGQDGPRRAASAQVHPTAVLRGPVVVQEDACVGAGALVLGPTVLGRGSRVGSKALVAHCVVAAGAEVPPSGTARQQVVTSVLGANAPVPMPSLEPMGAHLQMEAELPLAPGLESPLKRPLDLLASVLGLVLLSPLFLLIALVVKVDSRGTAFFSGLREGRGGRPFRCWKFRTMRDDADAGQRELGAHNQLDGPQFKIENDPRITPVGRWLRRSNLDELPQLLNVARGEMSLVGPRPSPFRENQICIPWREARLSVRPGITGLWQVCRRDRNVGDFHQWIVYDALYVEHMSLALDLKLLAATAFTLSVRRPVALEALLPTSAQPSLERRVAESRPPAPERVLRQEM